MLKVALVDLGFMPVAALQIAPVDPIPGALVLEGKIYKHMEGDGEATDALYVEAPAYAVVRTEGGVSPLKPALASTSPEVAAIAARGMTDPGSLTRDEIQSVCASALGQAS